MVGEWRAGSRTKRGGEQANMLHEILPVHLHNFSVLFPFNGRVFQAVPLLSAKIYMIIRYVPFQNSTRFVSL